MRYQQSPGRGTVHAFPLVGNDTTVAARYPQPPLEDRTLLERQMMNEDIGLQGQRQAQFGTGQERRGYENTRSTTNSSESGSRQVGPDIGALSSLLMPPGGPQQSTVSPNSGAGAIFGGLGDIGVAVGSQMYANRGGSSASSAPVSSTGQFQNPQLQCPDGRGSYPFCY